MPTLLTLFRNICWIYVILLSTAVMADMRISPAINPAVYGSQNKQYSLQVIPSDRRGIAEAEYSFLQGTKKLWHQKLPYTLVAVDVSNQGEVAGYAHSIDKNNKAELQLVLLDVKGKPRYHKKFTRESDRRLHGGYWPYASRVVVHDHNRSATFIVHHLDQNPQRLEISLNDGKTRTKEPLQYRMYDIDSILSSPYNEFSVSFGKKQIRHGDQWFYDMEFCLLNKGWEKLFCRQYPKDIAHDDQAALESLETAKLKAELMGFTAGQQFWFTSIKSRKQEVFSLPKSLMGIGFGTPQLAETRPLATMPTAKQDSKPLPSLRLVGKISLTQLAKPAVEDVLLAAFDAAGKKAVISRLNEKLQLEIFDQGNRKVGGHFLQVDIGELTPADLASYGNNQWLLLLSYFSKESRLLLLSSNGDLVREIPLPLKGISTIAVEKNGNIACIAKGGSGRDYASLSLINSHGDLLWKIQKHSSESGGLSSPEDVAISPSRQILVLDNIIDKLKSYDMKGQFLQELDLQEKQGMNSSYLTEMAVGKDGIVRVFDFSTGMIFIVRQWKLQEKIQPQEISGRSIGHVIDMDIDLQNRLWITSGGVLRRMNALGKEEAALPSHPALPDFEAINWMTVNAAGEVFIYDQDHFILSKVDARGNMVEIFRVPPEDQGGRSGIFNDGISKTNAGFLVHAKSNRYFEIDEAGKSVKAPVFECQDICRDVKIKRECNSACTSLTPQLNTQRFWQKDFYTLDLLDAIYPRKPYAHIEKASDNTWLEMIHRVYFSENGWVVIDYGEQGPTQNKIAVFDELGKPRAAFTHKGYAASMQVAGGLVYVLDYATQQIVVYSLEGERLSVTNVESDGKKLRPAIYVSPVNKKLYLAGQKTIKIYELFQKPMSQP